MVPRTPSRTAEVTCLMRARERHRPVASRIVDDPYAHLFLSTAGRAAAEAARLRGPVTRALERLAPGVTTFVLCRHRFMDDRLRAALAAGVEQVLILGAGYDTRAYRLAADLRGRTVFELDFPATSRRKVDIVRRNAARLPATRVVHVEIDFEQDPLARRLADAGFAAGTATFVVWEGVAPYLSRAAVRQTLVDLADLCGRGSELVMDFWHLPDGNDVMALARRVGAQLIALVGEPVTFALHPDDAAHLLGACGWTVDDTALAHDLEERYVRDGRRLEPSLYVMAVSRRGPGSDRRSGSGRRRSP
jgi:methyltransferase (TIGR00027 family)